MVLFPEPLGPKKPKISPSTKNLIVYSSKVIVSFSDLVEFYKFLSFHDAKIWQITLEYEKLFKIMPLKLNIHGFIPVSNQDLPEACSWFPEKINFNQLWEMATRFLLVPKAVL
ncbi:MAG: hypothetical protein U5L09_15345 [Bacteroidales bacterium]|nr:hypothetical protein [Bacteroidales bacterium]